MSDATLRQLAEDVLALGASAGVLIKRAKLGEFDAAATPDAILALYAEADALRRERDESLRNACCGSESCESVAEAAANANCYAAAEIEAELQDAVDGARLWEDGNGLVRQIVRQRDEARAAVRRVARTLARWRILRTKGERDSLCDDPRVIKLAAQLEHAAYTSTGGTPPEEATDE